jgi:hypothetical protein
MSLRRWHRTIELEDLEILRMVSEVWSGRWRDSGNIEISEPIVTCSSRKLAVAVSIGTALIRPTLQPCWHAQC